MNEKHSWYHIARPLSGIPVLVSFNNLAPLLSSLGDRTQSSFSCSWFLSFSHTFSNILLSTFVCLLHCLLTPSISDLSDLSQKHVPHRLTSFSGNTVVSGTQVEICVTFEFSSYLFPLSASIRYNLPLPPPPHLHTQCF